MILKILVVLYWGENQTIIRVVFWYWLDVNPGDDKMVILIRNGLPPGQIWYKIILMWEGTHESRPVWALLGWDTIQLAVFLGTQIRSKVPWLWWQLVVDPWQGFWEAGIYVTCAKPSTLWAWGGCSPGSNPL